MTVKSQGKVWLVGAGPSDGGLFTIKGKKVLEQADVVVYDKLVGQEVMSMVPVDAKRIPVGKVAGFHPIPQYKINEILLQEALEGNKVVRLKGGDPFLFGRGGEELELLVENNVPFEIVPGVTSAISVPAYNGIPVTHRDFCSSLHIITGHTKTEEEPNIDFHSLVKLDGTLVFLMGVSAMEKICRGLIDAGMDKDMPAAILERGTTAHQKRAVATLATLKDEAEKSGIKPPAIIVVGKVCSLEKRFHWAEDRMLGEMKIAVTRPRHRNSSLAEKLSYYGAEVVLMPTIETEIIRDNHMLYNEIAHIDQYKWMVFTSVEGVDGFYRALSETRTDIRKLAGIKVAVIGSATKKAVEDKGILIDLMPETYSGEDLGKQLANMVGSNERVLIPRAREGTEQVLMPLNEKGIEYTDVAVYDTREGIESVTCSYDESVDYVAFTSASTVRGFVKLNPQVDFSRVKAVCIGAQTAEAAREYMMQVRISDKATVDSMIETFLKIKQGG